MAPKKVWRFPPNSGGEIKGFNDAALDTFKGQRLSSMVREVIQNSLDAEKVKDGPIEVTFKIHRIPKNEAPEITLIRPHLEACRDAAKEQGLNDPVSFYENALKRIDEEKDIKVLAIHDANSKGLTGPTDKNFGAWSALVKGTGISQKSANSLGSFGHGSKAPFSLSDIRSIFYLSYVLDGKQIEKRFQGKSILQTHHIDGLGDTQGTGYFGWSTSDSCAPLLDEQIPEWAKAIRDDVDGQTGTTLILPYFQLKETELPETAISCIANFYYAIQEGNLVIDIDGETTLNKDNIKDKYYYYRDKLEEEQDFIDYERISDNFESLLAVVEPEPGKDGHGNQEVTGLDGFTWYLKLFDEDDDRKVKARVAIARKDGMLIKHNPWKLEKFQLVKPFEMFVCVDGTRGSELLKRIENPRHDDFEFDRIEDWVEREEAEKLYKRLANKIRDVIKRVAELSSSDETSDGTMNKWFGSQASADGQGNGSERATKISVGRTSSRFKKKNPYLNNPGDGPIGTIPGQGRRGKKGTLRTRGGPIPGPGPGIITGQGTPSTQSVKYTPLSNLRSVPSEGKKVKLIFDNPSEGAHQLIVERIGEEGRERVLMAAGDGTFVDQVSIELGHEERQEVTIDPKEAISGFALKASLVIEEEGDEA